MDPLPPPPGVFLRKMERGQNKSHGIVAKQETGVPLNNHRQAEGAGTNREIRGEKKDASRGGTSCKMEHETKAKDHL